MGERDPARPGPAGESCAPVAAGPRAPAKRCGSEHGRVAALRRPERPRGAPAARCGGDAVGAARGAAWPRAGSGAVARAPSRQRPRRIEAPPSFPARGPGPRRRLQAARGWAGPPRTAGPGPWRGPAPAHAHQTPGLRLNRLLKPFAAKPQAWPPGLRPPSAVGLRRCSGPATAALRSARRAAAAAVWRTLQELRGAPCWGWTIWTEMQQGLGWKGFGVRLTPVPSAALTHQRFAHCSQFSQGSDEAMRMEHVTSTCRVCNRGESQPLRGPRVQFSSVIKAGKLWLG